MMCDNQVGEVKISWKKMQKWKERQINKVLERNEFLNPHELSCIVPIHKIQLIKQITGLLVYYNYCRKSLTKWCKDNFTRLELLFEWPTVWFS